MHVISESWEPVQMFWRPGAYLVTYTVIQVRGEANKYEPPHDKTNRMTVHPAKTQINLGIRVFAARSVGS